MLYQNCFPANVFFLHPPRFSGFEGGAVRIDFGCPRNHQNCKLGPVRIHVIDSRAESIQVFKESSDGGARKNVLSQPALVEISFTDDWNLTIRLSELVGPPPATKLSIFSRRELDPLVFNPIKVWRSEVYLREGDYHMTYLVTITDQEHQVVFENEASLFQLAAG